MSALPADGAGGTVREDPVYGSTPSPAGRPRWSRRNDGRDHEAAHRAVHHRETRTADDGDVDDAVQQVAEAGGSAPRSLRDEPRNHHGPRPRSDRRGVGRLLAVAGTLARRHRDVAW